MERVENNLNISTEYYGPVKGLNRENSELGKGIWD